MAMLTFGRLEYSTTKLIHDHLARQSEHVSKHSAAIPVKKQSHHTSPSAKRYIAYGANHRKAGPAGLG